MVGPITAVAVWLSVSPTVRLSGQVSFHLAAGARYSSTLVHDSIVNPIDLRPAVAPTLLLTARHELNPGWSADVTLDVSPGSLRRHEGGRSFDAGSGTAWALTVGLRREFPHRLSARAGAGGLRYTGEQAGVFGEGSGGVFPIVTAAAAYTLRDRLEVELRYDVHRFITPALRAAGFVDPRVVHRVAMLARVGWMRKTGAP